MMRTSWAGRSAKVAKLGAKVGSTYASTAARKVFASTERRVVLDEQRELKTAAAVAEQLGHMKGALMKLGQMASLGADVLSRCASRSPSSGPTRRRCPQGSPPRS